MITTVRTADTAATIEAQALPPASVVTPPRSVSAAPPASLLPEPEARSAGSGGVDGIQDAMSMMYELVARQGDLSMQTGEVGINSATRQQEAEGQEQEAALKQEEADEAKLNSGGGLFSEIGHLFCDMGKDLLEGNLAGFIVDPISDSVNIVDNPDFPQQLAAVAPEIAEYVGIAAAVIGAAALTVATGGVGGAVVAAVVIALSASGTIVSKTQCFGKDSAYIGLGLDVAAAVTSFGASSAMLAGGVAQTATSIAQGVSGVADIGAGVSTIVTGNEQADVLDDTADVQQATVAMKRNARMIEDLVAGLQDAEQSNRTALTVLAGAAQTYGQTLTLTSSAKA